MQYIFLLVVIIMCAVQNALTKQYDIMAKECNAFFFSAVTSFAALLFYVISNGFRFTFSAEYLMYSLGFGIAFAVCSAANFLAIQWGSLSITGLVGSYSLILPAFYGLLVLDEKLGTIGIVGVVCLLISLFLINDTREKTSFSFKWLVALFVIFVTNGTAAILQKMQQLACDGAYKNEFMIVSMAIVTGIFVVITLVRKEKIREGFGLCAGFGALRGSANGIANLLTMVLAGTIPNTILYPSVSAGGVVLGFVIAVMVYKERLSRQQLMGYVIGTVSVVLLNL